MLNRYLLSLLSGALLVNTAFADMHFDSGIQQQVLLELYTSEGCNSCPPAEHFLNQLYQHPRLWQPYIPLAFHVDYWDALGWRDAYASKANTQRQRQYAHTLAARTIYTPEFFVNGKEWRPGFYSRLPAPEMKQVGRLSVDVDDMRLQAVFSPVAVSHKKLDLNIAVLGMDITSQIKAGENAGREAHHQFVVLAHQSIPSENNRWDTALPFNTFDAIQQTALVVWVSEHNSPVPLQAVGGFFKRGINYGHRESYQDGHGVVVIP